MYNIIIVEKCRNEGVLYIFVKYYTIKGQRVHVGILGNFEGFQGDFVGKFWGILGGEFGILWDI